MNEQDGFTNRPTKLILIIVCFFVLQLQAQETKPFTLFMGDGCSLGLLDEKQQELLPTQYASITTVSIGNDWLISAKKGNHFSYFLYKEGKAIPLKYPKVQKLNDRLLRVGQLGEYGIVNTDGKGILLMNYENIYSAGSSAAITFYNNAYGAVDLDGKIIVKNQYSQLKYWEMGGFWGLKNKQFQLINPQGKVVAEAQYDAVGKLFVDLPICAVFSKNKWGVITTKNEIVVPLSYNKLKVLELGMIAVLKDKKWQLLNLKGKGIGEKTFDKVEALENQALLVAQKDKLGLLDKEGKELLPIEYNSISYVGNNWVAVSKEAGLVQLFSLKERKFLTAVYEAVRAGDNFDECAGLLVQQEEKWAWLNYTPNKIAKPLYVNAYFYPNSTSIIVEGENKKIGCLNANGELILPIEYTIIVPKGTFFKVKTEDSNWFYVNKKNEVINCQIY